MPASAGYKKPLTGDEALPFAPRDGERFVITIYYDRVEVLAQSQNPSGTWHTFNTLWHTAKGFNRIIKNWYGRH